MKFLGILRGSALCLLAIGFRGPRGILCSNLEVNPYAESPTVEVSEISEKPNDSTVESSSQSDLVFKSSTWDDSKLASTFIFLKEFCKDVKGDKFKEHIPDKKFKDLSWACSLVSRKLRQFISHVPTNSALWNLYKDALKSDKFKDYAEWIVKYIPEIKKSVGKLHHETGKYSGGQLTTDGSKLVSKYGFVPNGDWYTVIVPDFHVKGKYDPSFFETFDYLRQTLDKILKDPQCEKASTTRKFLSLFSRGKKSDVNPQQEESTEESQVVEEAKISENTEVTTTNTQSDLVSENLEESTVKSQESLPSSHSELVFESSEWDDSMLASTVLFINEFCEDVKTKKFDGKVPNDIYEGLSKKCEYVSSYVNSFIHRFKPTYGCGTVDKRKEIPQNLYEGILKPEKFDDYIHWLVKNIPAIIGSVGNMYYESLDLTEEQLNEFSSYGPPKYGFVYTGYWWGELTHGLNRGFFKYPDISQSFKDLQKSLEKVMKSSPKRSIVEAPLVKEAEDSTVKSQAV
ncbi:secreted antigen 1 [Babesia divergens]|uniref:Secreted antigen 1 n=1 Tax=Babesia divergens TaxID=32595 RepID=A0AAD9GDM4_BABDI|nr:secreted antigen 1 [Babesia divergens]